MGGHVSRRASRRGHGQPLSPRPLSPRPLSPRPLSARPVSSAARQPHLQEEHTPPLPRQPLPPAAPPEPPSFDTRASGNVTALLGGTATLRCRVTSHGKKTVSWIRHWDLHLLSVGRFTYTSDQRFVARHAPVPAATAAQKWLLIIHHLQERDAGLYECQIFSTPPRSHLIHLAVVEPETAIVGGPDVYLNTGSQLALTCTVRFSPEPPAFILWYHGDKQFPAAITGVTLHAINQPSTRSYRGQGLPTRLQGSWYHMDDDILCHQLYIS
ncbi:immunoglobulin superfamily member 10-like [Eriocheir sinensis]|uniref:immunoglobulin superfamily member 10-like n=1 Tax=Eriocheir sinensis TaxID=95602 RepID=UPI0021C5CFDB|nr:immunoglobulin superfamily member 10-like [Eriocheir sinensis]